MRHLVLALAMGLGLAAPAMAQAPPLTLREAVRTALESHPATVAARLRVAAAESWAGGAGAQPNPELRLSATLGEPGEDANLLVQRLEIGGQTGLRRDAARAGAEAARQAWQAVRRDVARRTAAAYYGVWQTEAGLAIARQRLELARQLERASRARLEEGEISENAHLRTQLEVARADADVAAAGGQASAERARLNLLLGREPGAPVLLPVAPDGEPHAPDGLGPAPENPGSTASLPELEALRSAARAARLEAELAGRARAPDLELSAYRTRLLGSSPGQGLQVSLVFPLGDHGSVAAREAQLRAEAGAREGDVAARALEVEMELAAAVRVLEASEARRDILHAQLARARRLAEMARVGYEAGLLSLPEVLDAQTAFRQALGDFVTAEAALRQAQADLYLLSGGPLPDAPQLLEGTTP